ncbi:hypothetical protein [Macellibacteroides fermentans]|jgi:hypothetical protein|uniref:hypothetical protein n=1 Tax=Macellibacteroides fermentans TaxID=879969 RepID=UPI0008299C56
MKIQHSLLVSVFVIIAIGTLFMSIVKKETKKGILSEVTMIANNKIVLRFDNDSSLYYVNIYEEQINVSKFNSQYIGKPLEIKYNKPIFFDSNNYPVICVKADSKTLFSID